MRWDAFWYWRNGEGKTWESVKRRLIFSRDFLLLTFMTSEGKLRHPISMCIYVCGCVITCTFDQTFIIGPVSSLDFESMPSSCQPTTLLLCRSSFLKRWQPHGDALHNIAKCTIISCLCATLPFLGRGVGGWFLCVHRLTRCVPISWRLSVVGYWLRANLPVARAYLTCGCACLFLSVRKLCQYASLIKGLLPFTWTPLWASDWAETSWSQPIATPAVSTSGESESPLISA